MSYSTLVASTVRVRTPYSRFQKHARSHPIKSTSYTQSKTTEIIRRFRSAVEDVKARGKRPKLAMFDTVLTFPGVRFPWETLVATCKDLGIMSLIDGAHGIGHIDLTHLGNVGPDFLITDCPQYAHPRICLVHWL